MKVLIVGAGGREHALAWKSSKSSNLTELFVTPGNGGIETFAECWGTTDHEEILTRVLDNKIDLVIIGQDDYLVDGLTDKLEAKGIKVCGPSQAAAALEGSKAFSKDFMKRHKIPTAAYAVFSDLEIDQAREYIRELDAPLVIKADGLAAGKGVLICQTEQEAQDALDTIMVNKAFGSAGSKVVIEEFLKGEEASYFIFTDGKDFVSMPSLQDHKRQKELDQGLNTGGMGCYSPAPVVTDQIEEKIIEQFVRPTLEGMASEDNPYKGIIYFGFMIDGDEIKLLEYNSRFGDPECQPLMMLLDSDLNEIALAIAEGRLADVDVKWKNQAAACVILASGGYPEKYQTGYTIQGLEEIQTSDEQMIFHAGTKLNSGRFQTTGGRVLAVTCLGDDFSTALNKSYKLVNQISWPDMQYRRDIGLKGQKRMLSNRKGEKQVLILMGSVSDANVAKKATALFDRFGIGYDMLVSSAHRTPERTRKVIEEGLENGVEVIIAIAGMSAHLPGVVAAEAQVPVIGVPVNASHMGGNDALLSIVQMPPGIPVATVGVDRGDNAALLATQILGLKYPEIAAHHQEYRLEMEQNVLKAQAKLEEEC